MQPIIPPKLKPGDEVRVVAASCSLATCDKVTRQIAADRFGELGLTLSFGKHVLERDDFDSSSIESRLSDLHEAFADPKVKMILCARGGYNANQLLDGLDFSLIKKHPKILCGYSDITILSNAILAKTGLVSYSGPNFSTFGPKKGFEYTLEYFKQALFQKKPYEILPSKRWSDDPWHKDQDHRHFHRNKGYLVIQEGKAEGTILGGNLRTFNLLRGTKYMPSLKDSILFLEDDNLAGEHGLVEFDRNLQSLIHQPGFSGVRGIVLGRFQKKTKTKDALIEKMIRTKKELRHLPVIANADFGHTDQQCTFPIGGRGRLIVKGSRVRLTVLSY
jgi:muramoyltetrapeptide carboxypeptidase